MVIKRNIPSDIPPGYALGVIEFLNRKYSFLIQITIECPNVIRYFYLGILIFVIKEILGSVNIYA